jgi:hypothetical protein
MRRKHRKLQAQFENSNIDNSFAPSTPGGDLAYNLLDVTHDLNDDTDDLEVSTASSSMMLPSPNQTLD